MQDGLDLPCRSRRAGFYGLNRMRENQCANHPVVMNSVPTDDPSVTKSNSG